MVIVTMRQTMQAAILMVVTVVETTLTPNIVMNAFVINKLDLKKVLSISRNLEEIMLSATKPKCNFGH